MAMTEKTDWSPIINAEFRMWVWECRFRNQLKLKVRVKSPGCEVGGRVSFWMLSVDTPWRKGASLSANIV